MSRLTKQQKEILIDFATDKVEKMFPLTAINKLEKEIIELLYAEHLKKYPKNEMEILQKYHCTNEVTTFSVRKGIYEETLYKLKVPFSFTFPQGSYNERLILSELSPIISDKLRSLIKAFEYRNHCINLKLANYKALVNSSTNIKQVVEVWSEADVFVERFTGNKTALCVINNDAIAEIRQDVLARKEVNND